MADRIIALNDLRAGRLVRPARLFLCAAFLGTAAILPSAEAQAQFAYSAPVIGQAVSDFYAGRGGRPLWLDDAGSAGQSATILMDYLRSADVDGLDPNRYPLAQLTYALRAAWGGSPDSVQAADMLLSEAFVHYVADLKGTPAVNIVWVDPELKPRAPSPRQLLEAAASAPSLEAYVAEMRWMHPIYAGLRQAMVLGHPGPGEQQRLRLNMERAKALPSGEGRYVMVNATAQRLEMYEDGRVVDSMRVVVGKPKNPTPLMAAFIRFTSLNPYWFVPPDLAAERIAPNVLKSGLGYLKTQGYQVMSDWTDDATIIDPATIDWQAVADGSRQVLIRQLPGPANAMGQMKFMFPNSQGVYLHDTPQKELLTEASRMFSGGCVRLEDAPRLAAWLHGKPLTETSKQAELRVDLPRPVPVFITYLTVIPDGAELATYPDVYGRDRDELAMASRPLVAGR